MSRSARIALVVATACLGGPATASACLLQGGGANPVGYGPDTLAHAGDPMQYTISKLDEGATYTVTIGGRVIADHVEKTEAGLGEVKRTFRLPDYGAAPRTLAVSVYVFHEGGGSSHEDTLDDFLPPSDPLRYEPPVAARPTPQPEPPAGAPAPSGGHATDAAQRPA